MKLAISGKMSDGSDAPYEIMSNVIWKIEDTSIAKIENGVIKPLKLGTTRIIGTVNGISTSVELVIADVGLRAMSINKPKVNAIQGTIIDIDW